MVSLGAGIYSPSSRSRGVDARWILTRGRPYPFRPKPRTLSPPGEVAAFKPERWPLSNRNRGRIQIGTVAAFKSEQVAAFRRNLHRPVAHVTRGFTSRMKVPYRVTGSCWGSEAMASIGAADRAARLAELAEWR